MLLDETINDGNEPVSLTFSTRRRRNAEGKINNWVEFDELIYALGAFDPFTVNTSSECLEDTSTSKQIDLALSFCYKLLVSPPSVLFLIIHSNTVRDPMKYFSVLFSFLFIAVRGILALYRRNEIIPSQTSRERRDFCFVSLLM